MKKNINDIKHVCAGCGVCAGICKFIQMHENEFGQYWPKVTDGCVNCGRCIAVCPEINPYEDADISYNVNPEMKYNFNTGYYLSCYDGYVEKRRRDCASGGMCSELLINLMNQHMVDAIYCAVNNGDPHKFYICSRLTTEEEIRQNTRSAYYPIEISQTVESIRKRDENVAIVCLPCQAKALRLAMKQDKRLESNVKYIIGLVCGGLPGKAMVEYIARAINIKLDDITRITFREKDDDVKCNNCQIKFYDRNGCLKGISRYHGEAFGFAFFNKFFSYDACWTCDDIFAEYADIVFGDAWYKENTQEILGTSICLVRNSDLDKIIPEMGENIKPVDVEKLVEAQKNVGVVDRKKNLSAEYANIFRRKGYVISNNIENKLNFKAKVKSRLYILFNAYERKQWKKYKAGNITFSRLDKRLHLSVNIKRRIHL